MNEPQKYVNCWTARRKAAAVIDIRMENPPPDAGGSFRPRGGEFFDEQVHG